MSKNEDREIRLLENLALGFPVSTAGVEAGYTKGYSTSGLYQKFNNPAFISKLQQYVKDFPETRRNLAKLRLPKLYEIEERFLQKCMDDPELYARYPKVSERDYKLAGLGTDEQPSKPTVQVAVLVNVQSALAAQIDQDDVVDVSDNE